MRWKATPRGVDASTWPVAAELLAQFRNATEQKRWDRRYMLRREADELGISTETWDLPDSPPEDTEQEVRAALLQELEGAERPEEMGGYCQLLSAFAVRAKEAQAKALEDALKATARYLLEHVTESAQAVLAQLPSAIAFQERGYQRTLSLSCLARLSVLQSVERLLRRHEEEEAHSIDPLP